MKNVSVDAALSRRGLLRGIAVAFVAVGAGAASAQGKAGCGEPDTPKQRAQKTALQFQTVSPFPDKRCGGCAFFDESEDEEGCGKCRIIMARVSAASYCKSWAKR